MWGLRGRQEKKEEWRSSQDGQRGLPPETKMAPGQVFFCEAHPHPMGSWTPSATGQQPPGTSCSLRTSIPLCSRPSQHLNLSQLWSSGSSRQNHGLYPLLVTLVSVPCPSTTWGPSPGCSVCSTGSLTGLLGPGGFRNCRKGGERRSRWPRWVTSTAGLGCPIPPQPLVL